MSGCFSRQTSTTGLLVFVQTSPGRRHPPSLLVRWTDRPPASSRLNAALSSPALRQCTSHQACVYTPLLEVEAEVNPIPDLHGLAGAQGLSKYHMGEDEGYLGITLPIKHP